MNKLSPYEAKYNNTFEVPSLLNSTKTTKVSAISKLGLLIDSTWKYSWHWPNDHNAFLDKAQDDLNSEIAIALKRISELHEAQSILFSIEREEIEQ